MPKTKLSRWQRHKLKWSNCTSCELCKTRTKTVLLRGSVPCDVFFIGDAPGKGEDKLGQPFIGEAGHLLDRMISDAFPPGVRTAFTNLIACIPLDMDGEKVKQPHKEHIFACADRLKEVVEITKPKCIVMVGKLSQTYIPKILGDTGEIRWKSIVHPATILRADISQKGLAIQKTIIQIRDVWEEEEPF